MKAIKYALLLAVISGACTMRTAPAQGSARVKIAVVNLGAVFDKYYKKQELDASLRAERAKKHEVIQEKGKELAKLEEEMSLFDLGTDARKRTEETLYRKRVEFETYRKLAQEEWVRKQREFTVRLFEDINERIAEYAKSNGIDLVLKVDDTEVRAATLDMVQLEIKLRSVLYYDASLDVTDKLIAALNAGKSSR